MKVRTETIDNPDRLASTPPTTGMRRRHLAGLVLSGVALAAPWRASQAQQAWRGLDVPAYPNATDVRVSTDDDEYEIYFNSSDDVKKVFDFYRDYLTQQGFKVSRTKDKKHGFKADLKRGQGGPNDSIELDAKVKNGRHKVEIEFDDWD